MQTLILAVHFLVAVALVALVLLQRGKGADMGSGFGAGASSTVFGARGATSFLAKLTAGLATLFFASSLTLAWLSGRTIDRGSVVDRMETSAVETQTAAPPATADQAVPPPPGAAPGVELTTPPVETDASGEN